MPSTERYLGSSDGLQMQQQAAQSISQSTQKAIDQTNQGVQEYLGGVVQSSQRIMELQQTKAALDANRQPSAVAEFAQNAVGSVLNWKKQEQLERAKLLEEQKQAKREQDALDKEKQKEFAAQKDRFFGQLKAGRATDFAKQVAEIDQQIDVLTSVVESDNWKDGESYYRTQARDLISKLNPVSEDEVKQVYSLMQKVGNTVVNRSRQVGTRLQSELEKQQGFNADKAKLDLMRAIYPQVSWIKKAGITDPDGSSRLNWVVGFVNEWTKDDSSGLPYNQRLRISSEVLADTYKFYFDKVDVNTEEAAKLREFDQWLRQSNAVSLRQSTGELTYQQAENERARLDTQYPEFSRFHVKPGDREAYQLRLAEMERQRQDIAEKAGLAAADKVVYDNDVVRAIAANGFLDPTFLERDLKNSPIKNNRNIQAAVSYVELLKRAEQEGGALKLDIQQKNTQILRTQLNSVEQYLSTQRRLALKKKAGEQFDSFDEFVAGAQQQIRSSNPQLQSLLDLLQNQADSGKELDPAVLQQANRLYELENAKIVSSQQQEVNLALNNFQNKYADLIGLGLIDGYGRVDRKVLQQRAKTGQAALENLQNKINQAQLEVNNQFQNPSVQFGQTGNFNSSSTFVPVTDDRGRLALVPRKQAQVQKIDGVSIVTPTVAGSNALTTSRGQRFGAPRPYRNGIHQGLDFNLGRGGKAISLLSGTVVYTGKLGGYGGVIDIIGDNGLLYRYTHQLPLVKVGQRVYPGQVVSQSNGSGVNIGGDHLHFEVRSNPKFVNGKYVTNGGTPIDPLPHLKGLSAGSSDLLQPRVNQSLLRAFPHLKAPANSTLLSNGGVLNGNTYQRAGSKPQQSSSVFNGQRPAKVGAMPAKVRVGAVSYDVNDDLGYAELRKDDSLRQAIVQTAKSLGVPPEWIADIARQESGLNPRRDHWKENPRANPNLNYGLFGFGSDSFSDKSIITRLRSGQIDAIGQLKLYERYIKENGWNRIVQKKNGLVTIADLWALSKFGTKARNRILETGNYSVKSFPGTSLTYMDELELLGKWVGRRYDFGRRSSRNQAVSESTSAFCSICAKMEESGAFAPHVHETSNVA